MTTWLDRQLYPFESRFLEVPDGRIHYVDEGSGDVILMLHGTPTWSFLYRHLIAGLRGQYRVIAPDHLGFGLSAKPADYSYRPEDQARNLRAFIQALDLPDFTLMAHDFGGPIGLSYAVDRPERVRRLILFNTWMWSLRDQRQTALLASVLGSGFGRFLYRKLNFEFNVIVPALFADRSKLTAEIKAHYLRPFDDPIATHVAWVQARELLQSSDWFDSLWAKRAALQNIPALLLWGMKDAAFGAPQLKRWQSVLTRAQVHPFSSTGHFVQEEQGADLVPFIESFLGGG